MMETYVPHVLTDILLIKEVAQPVDRFVNHANQVLYAINVSQDISGMEKIVKAVESLIVNHAKRLSYAISAKQVTI
jgi:hypothetical protein